MPPHADQDSPKPPPSRPPEEAPELSALTDEQLEQVSAGGGSWSGYWTYDQSKTPPAWVWTWVWNQDARGGWATS